MGRYFMSLLCLAIAFLFLLFSVPEHANALTGTERSVSYGGVSFTYDSSLASDVVGSTLPEVAENDGSIGWFMAHPGHIMFEFKGFVAKPLHNPAIYIFPVRSDYKSLSAGSREDYWVGEVDKLRRLLSQKPDLRSLATERQKDIFAANKRQPFLPPINAGSFPLGKEEYLVFRNGSGIRYLFYLAQDASPPEPDETGYTFQGMTNDGKYYVAAKFPAAPSSPLPTPLPSGTDSIQQIREAMTNLEKVNNQDYIPNLNILDEMMKSLKVDSAAISLQGSPSSQNMPGSGSSSLLTFYSMALVGILLALLIGTMTLLFNREARGNQ